MKLFSEIISIDSSKPIEIKDITDDVKDIVSKIGLKDGMVFITTAHTTAGICINEPCDRLKQDVEIFLSKLTEGFDCKHDDDTIDGRKNGRAHLAAHLLPRSEMLRLENGELKLGKWQAVFFVELDGSRRGRLVEVTVMGL